MTLLAGWRWFSLRAEGALGFVNLLATRHPVATVGIVAVVLLMVAVPSALGLLHGYLTDLDRNRTWIRTVRIPLQDRMMNVIFDRAVETGLIWSEADSTGVRIALVSCENRSDDLSDQGIGPRGDRARRQRELLSLLCTTEEGGAIREEIRQWNASEHIIAIRDDRRYPAGAEPGRTTAQQAALACDPPPRSLQPRRPDQPALPTSAFGTVPRQCLHNRWDMFVHAGRTDDPETRLVAVQPSGLEPAPTDYDFIEEGTPLYMTDWASLTPQGRSGLLGETAHRLQSEIVLPPSGRLRIDVVGSLRRVRVAGLALDLGEELRKARAEAQATTQERPPGQAPAPFTATLDGLKLRVVPLCEGAIGRTEPESAIHCLTLPDGVPFSYKITVEGEPKRKVGAALDIGFQRSVARAFRNRIVHKAETSSPAPLAANAATEDPEGEPDEDPNSMEGDTADDDSHWRIETRTPNLVVACPQEFEVGRPTACRVSWRAFDPADEPEDGPPDALDDTRPEARRRLPVPSAFRVFPADSKTQNLVDEQTGAFTAQSLELGLAPIVGGGSSQYGSLGWALKPGEGEERIATLTINAREQAIVRDVLEERRMKCRGKAPPRDCVFHRAGAQAVVALVDASLDHAGEVRALVSWPPGRVGAHIWDIAAGGGLGSDWRSPATARTAWSVGFDGSSQPGSTFKVVTALASAQRVLEEPSRKSDQDQSTTIGRMLRGDVSAAETVRILRVRKRLEAAAAGSTPCRESNDRNSNTADALQVLGRQAGTFRCLQNFDKGPHARQFRIPSATFCGNADGRPGSGAGQAASRLGLCEAIAQSSNIYFGGLALLLDRTKVVKQGLPETELSEPSEKLEIARMADRLAPPNEKVGRDLMRGSLPRQSSFLRLDPKPVTIDVTRPDPEKAGVPLLDRRVSLALAGYGQNVYASPLVVASVYASLSRGKIVQPRLVPVSAAAPLEEQPQILNGGPEAERFLASIRSGLANVVAGAYGTARSTFSPRQRSSGQALADLRGSTVQPRLFGKTGTATISGRFNTLWFAGWIEGRPDRGIQTPLAFVCQATRQPAGQKLTGGSVCAPIMRDILLRLDRVAASEPAPPAPVRPRPARPQNAPVRR